MAGLPLPGWLPLSEAISLIANRRALSMPEAREALVRAGREGKIHARGAVPLNASRDPELAWRRAAARRDEDLESGSWAGDIDWAIDRIGRSFRVMVERSSLDRWLDPEGTSPITPLAAPSRESIRATLERRAASGDEENIWDIVNDASAAYEQHPQRLLAETLDAINAGTLEARARPSKLPDDWREKLPLPYMADRCRQRTAPYPNAADPGVFGFLRDLLLGVDTFLGWMRHRGLAPASAHQASPQIEAVMPTRTGLAGRPSSWHMIEEECRRRFAAGQGDLKTSQVAKELRDWFVSKYPTAPAPTEKTIRNKLPSLLREIQRSPKT